MLTKRMGGAMRAVLSFLFAIIFGQNAFAGSYSVTMREFGFNRQNCSRDVAAVAQAFAGDAQAIILSSGCLPPEVGESFPSGNFTYMAPNWVVTSTSDVRESWGLDGYYTSIAECESARLLELKMFAQLTGLRPFVSYCYQSNTVGAPRYRVRIDAVGASAVKKRSSSASWMYTAVNERSIASGIESLVTSLGGQVVDRHVSGNIVAIDYYHKKEFHLHSQELLYWSSSELCLLSAKSMNEQWGSAAVKSIFHCVTMSGGKSRLLQIYASNNILSGFDFDTEVFATAYSSESACLSDASRIRNILERSGTIVLGMTCGQESALQSWRMAVLSQTE